jgi:hypothetical protein
MASYLRSRGVLPHNITTKRNAQLFVLLFFTCMLEEFGGAECCYDLNALRGVLA